MAVYGEGSVFAFTCCFLVLSINITAPATRASVCLKDESGKCVDARPDDADVNELMQMRIRVGSSELSPGDDALQTQESMDINNFKVTDRSMRQPHEKTCKVDAFGLVQSGSEEEPRTYRNTEPSEAFEYDDSERTGSLFIRNYADDPYFHPYLEELAFLEEEVKSEVDDTNWMLDSEGEYDDEQEEEEDEKELTGSEVAQKALKEAFDKQANVNTRPRKMTDIPRPPVLLQSGKMERHEYTSASGAVLVTEKLFERINCHHNYKTFLGHFNVAKDCAEEAFKKGFTYFLVSTKLDWKHCEGIKTAQSDCPVNQGSHDHLATYRVYEKDKPIVFDMFPKAGSVAGGQLVTFRGAFLYEAHDKMEGKKDEASALKAPIQIVFMDTQGKNVSLECPLENFESRHADIKCVTPPLSDSQMFLADMPLYIMIVKISKVGIETVRRPQADDVNKVISYKYSTGATPEVSGVTPVSAGPGMVITIQGYSCSGIVESDPVQLVKIVAGNKTVEPNSSDAESTELVPDPETAFGHICEPWPPLRERLNFSDANKEIIKSEGEDDFGAIGLDAVEFKLDSMDPPQFLSKWIEEQTLSSAPRWIQPTPWLDYAKYWRNKKHRYVARLQGKIIIDRAGDYEFTMACLREGYMKINGKFMKGIYSHNKGTKVKWGHHGRIHTKITLESGMHKIEFAHAVTMNHPHHSALEVKYKGLDTSNQWSLIPEYKLRAGITREAINKLEQNRLATLDQQEQYLVEAETIFADSSKGIGMGKCPNDKHPKLVAFKCKVAEEMEPGFYDIKFQDHEYGESVTNKKAQWIAPTLQMVTMKIVPVIKAVEQDEFGKITVKGHGLDGLQDSDVSYLGATYEKLSTTQDVIELVKGPSLNDSAVEMGARGMLREFWYSYEFPDALEAKGDIPAWTRASKLETDIKAKPGNEASGFSERLTGLFVPPFSGQCRWRAKGQPGADQAKLFFNEVPMSEQSEAPGKPVALPKLTPFFYYAGRSFDGSSSSYENLYSVFPTELSGAMSFAFTSNFDQNQPCCWNRIIDFGAGSNNGNINIARDSGGRTMYWGVRDKHHCKDVRASNAIRYGEDQNWLMTLSSSGMMRIYLEGVLVGQNTNGWPGIPKAVRKNMYVGKSNWDNDKMFKGSVKKLRIYEGAIKYQQAYGDRDTSEVVFKTVRYGVTCEGHGDTDLQWKKNPVECAKEAKKRGFKFFRFGKYGNYGRCYGESTSECTKFWNDGGYDVYKVVPATSGTSNAVQLLPFASDPLITIAGADEKKSEYFDFQAGKAYPIKLERKVQARTQETGLTGWSKLGIECRTINSTATPELGALLPQASYEVSMKFKQYKAEVTLPKSAAGYKISFGGRTETVSNDDDAGPSLYNIFGAKCKTTKTAGTVKFRQEFNDAQYAYGRGYCDTGFMKAPLDEQGIWTTDRVKLVSTNYQLKDHKFLHMCYKIAPMARVNLLVRGRVGWRNRQQWFSIGMTDGLDDPQNNFHHDYRRAAQFALKIVNGTTTGTWECTSLNLYDTVMAFESYERRFHDIDYHRANTDPGHSRAPGPMLSKMKIEEIWLGTARYVHSQGRWARLEGESMVDTLVASSAEFAVSSTPSTYTGPLPFKVAPTGWATSAGWIVEWINDDKGFFGKAGAAGNPWNNKVKKTTVHDKLWLDGCGAGLPEIGDCNNYGWRAKAVIELPANTDVKFQYQNDDEIRIFVNDQHIGHRGCCRRGWHHYMTYKTGAAGAYRVEVQLWQGGGGNYGGVRWGYNNKWYDVPSAGSGVSRDHKVQFKPISRTKLPELKTFLEQVTFTPSAGETLGNKVSFSPGVPPAPMVEVTQPAKPPSFEPVVTVDFSGPDQVLSKDVGKTKFNQLFKQCPVVKYIHNGKVHAIYVRTSAVPAAFDAYKLFTQSWRSEHNTLNTDFKLYSSEGDLLKDKDAWDYCNYNDNNVGFPRDCRRSGVHTGRWFRMPDRGGASQAFTTYGFEMQTGSCVSPVGSAYKTPKTAEFDMDADPANISATIMSVGVPELEADVIDVNGIKWMDMSTMTATQSSQYSHGKSEYAIDGQWSKIEWGQHSCTHTNHDKNAWWSVNLGAKVQVDKVKIAGRKHHVGSQLRGAVIALDGVPCHDYLDIHDRQTKVVSCIGTASTLSVYFPASRKDHLSICELSVGTTNTNASYDEESDTFSFKVTYTKETGYVPPPLFSSPLAEEVKVTTISAGTRFLSDITDAYLRMPHDAPQLAFEPWSSYICDTATTKGCEPVFVPAPPSSNNSNNTNGTMLLERAAVLRQRVTTHNRRHPQRKWRLPPRFHTEETLEKMRRRVFGFAKEVRGWSDTSFLLQTHAGKQKHFSTGVRDPRKDPNMMAWSDPKSWGGEAPPNKDTTDIVYIPEGKTAKLDMNVNIRFWVLEGNVVWDMTKNIHMEAEAIVVNGGQLLIGSETEPYPMLGQITLHGHWHTFKLPLCGAKTIFQTRGNIEMHGIPVPTTWSQLDYTALPGDREIYVQGALDWKPGNMIVIAASDKLVMDCRLDRRDDCQVEERFISKIETGPMSLSDYGGVTTIITVDRPLVYRHLAEELPPYFGEDYCGTAEAQADPLLCGKTQVRAEVGLLTRNIVVKGSNYHDGSGPAGSEGFGGHLMHAEKAKYSYIEFFWMGQAFQMGRYPLHLHLTGLNPTSYIKGCSLHRTFMRGITVHGTHSATIKDNVLYNVMAHGYFIEDGNEHNNLFENNLGMMVHKSFSALVSDQTPAVFWIRNPSNYFRYNHAAGGAAFGFWFDTHSAAPELGIKQFLQNTAHSNGNTGIWVDIVDPREGCTASSEWTIKVPGRDSDAIAMPEHDNAPSCKGKHRTINDMKHVTTWGNGAFGMTFFEVGHIHLINHRSIKDPTGILVWGIQSDDWPDPTNGFNGPTLMRGVYSTESDLPDSFKSSCSIGGPWDDTLLVYGTQFIGKVGRGHFCPCFECLAMEGGYETHTAKLGWHAGAGTTDSVKASWPWLYATNFFDIDGTLTEDVLDCKFYGCYLHAPFEGDHAGMYSRRKETQVGAPPPKSGGPPKKAPPKSGGGGKVPGVALLQEDPQEESLIMMGVDGSSDGSLAEAEYGDEGYGYDPNMFMQTTRTQELIECKKSLSNIIPVEKITANRYEGNRNTYGKGEMWRSKIYFDGDPSYCGQRRTDDYVQYDFGEPTWVTGVQTRGRKNSDQWLKTYKVQYTVDGSNWILMDTEFQGNRNRNTIQENRFQPVKATKMRVFTKSWHNHNCFRMDFLGCSGDLPLTMTCVDSPYLDTSKRSCSTLERELGPKGMKDFCDSDAGKIAMHTALSAKQACCACGAGVNVVAQDIKPNGTNQTSEVPEDAPIKVIPGGTGYFDPKLCKMIDETGGVVCKRQTRMNTITVKSAGIWHMMLPIEVQSDFGFAEMKLAFCYQQYEFTVHSGNRYLLVPPYTPKKLVDWDVFSAEITMTADSGGDKYVLQWETIHNPDGYTVNMANVEKKFICDDAPMQYDDTFNNNRTLINILKTETDMHSVQKLKLSQGFIFDMYKVAHLPLLDRAGEADSAGMWGYIQANESYDFRYWYPGMFNALITHKGISYSSNHLGPWDGRKKNPLEQYATRPINNKREAASFGFSQLKTPMSWKRWDLALPPPPGANKPPPQVPISRLLFLVRYCAFNPDSMGHASDSVMKAVKEHEDVKNGKIKVKDVIKFKWSQWPAALGGKPTAAADPMEGLGNVTIEANWEVTIDEDVDFINKLNISGVLKFEDKAGCCKLVARYIMVGPLFGKIEAGTESNPITNGIAHIILKGQPMTPPLKHFRPHVYGSAKWLKSKFLAVMGTLSLHGKTRSKTWVKLAQSVTPGSTTLEVEGGDFKVGDVIAINHGAETKTIKSVAGTTLTLDSPVQNSYRGADHVYNGRIETKGMMAAHIGLVDGYNVIVEGEDTPGVPMCHVSATKKCPYAKGLGGGMNLHDFAKEMRHYLEKTGAAQHPNCRPCLAVSEMDFAGYIIGMAHFSVFNQKCPKDHGVIDVTGVAFKHGSNLRLYHGYTGGNYPHDLATLNFPAAWAKFPHVWWKDPLWSELKQPDPPTPEHQIAYSAFNNTHCGAAFALANAGKQVIPTKPVTNNVILGSAVGINGAARPMKEIGAYSLDLASPKNDNFNTITQGVGAAAEFGTFGYKMKYSQGPSDFQFVDNMLIRSTFVVLKGGGGNRVVTGNVVLGPVYFDGCPTTSGQTCFANNIINSPSTTSCIYMRSSGEKGIADNTVFGCRIAVGFGWFRNRESTVRRMKILDSNVGIHYWAHGPDSKSHNAKREQFEVTDVELYAKENGAGTGIRNPKVHSDLLGQPVPDWWHGGTNFFPMGHAAPCLFFKSMLSNIKFVGYKKAAGGVALTVGEGHGGDTSDADYHPVFVSGLKFENTAADAYMRFAKPSSMGNSGVRKCIQIDCDGRRNSLVVDEDGSLIGTPGTVISFPWFMYDKLRYVDPMGFDTMEDLIPMPARYDAVGDAIPFPSGVDHGYGGGLEYICNDPQGCEVLYMQRYGNNAGQWLANPNQTLSDGDKIVAVREDGGHIFLDPLFHGWDRALGTVYTHLCQKTMDPKDSPKPESQHARRYGRVTMGSFGSHINASKIASTVGPVYSLPGVYRNNCTYNSNWGSYECPKGRQRHLLIEVMDWNHMVRRWAPVYVEVNDQYAPQGGFGNVLTGPAMYWTSPMMRLQSFHALGHVGMRHNVYFSADPPSHLRLHLQYADPQEGVIVCVYYGLPNLIQAYVGGAKKPPLFVPTWDNLVFAYLNTSMPHGTYYYDRIGVETRRPGYLYTVIKGDHHVDFKISHKIVLTSKVTVTSTWGGWKNDKHANGSSNDNNNDFFKSGINGLVRNIALLIGAPPSRVAILGQGRATAGTFWNSDTTSEEFAEWMWTQNKSMDRKTMKEWANTPGAKLKNASKAPSLAQVNHRHVAFLQQFAEHRRHIAARALVQEGRGADTWHHELSLLSTEEEAMIHERRVSDMLEAQGESHYKALNRLQALAWSEDEEDDNDTFTMIVDTESDMIPPTIECDVANMKDCATLEQHDKHVTQLQTDVKGMDLLENCVPNGTSMCTLPSDNATADVQSVQTDYVPTKNNPKGWKCDFSAYDDGTYCDCDCGIWDPDCDLFEAETDPALLNSTDQILLLDSVQARAAITWVDKNMNFVIDGDEILSIPTLGASALYSMAETVRKAQEMGENVNGENRKGNFAWMETVKTSSCDKLLSEAGLTPKLATYTPKCVKDTVFDLSLGSPTGRCAIQPEMQIGSQCHVPGGGFFPAPRRGTNMSVDKSVCGAMLRIFSGGLGVGGVSGAGVGPSTAQWFHPGGEMVPGAAGVLDPIDMKSVSKGLDKLEEINSFKNGFSFYCRIKFNSWADYGRIFSIWSYPAAHWRGELEAYIYNGDQRKWYDPKMPLRFVDKNWRRSPNRYRGKEFLTPEMPIGEEIQLLFTMSGGKMKVFRNSVEILSENNFHEWDTTPDFSKVKLFIGKRADNGHNKIDAEFRDIRVWNRPVTWDVAIQGVPPDADPGSSVPQDDDGEDVEVPCIASKLNTFDFACQDYLSEDVAKVLGYEEEHKSQAETAKFEKRAKMGDITICTSKASTKGVVFAGKFGDGLTAEYYRMRTHCHMPPFTFGSVPSVVRVDPVVQVPSSADFKAPYNEFAIRWGGKLLIHTAGEYEFELTANDGAWLAVDSFMATYVDGCRHASTTKKATSKSTTLSAGGHDIAILYFNRGPAGASIADAKIILKYKGPDSANSMVVVPTENLGSDPLRLAKLAKDTDQKPNVTEIKVTPYGKFIYDEENGVALMPEGSCDFYCQKGQRKTAAAQFKYFCKTNAEVSFIAEVGDHSTDAMMWFDSSEEVVTWSLLKSGTGLLQKSSVVTNATMNEETMLNASLGMGAFSGKDYTLTTSAESPSKKVLRGVHTLFLQGRPLETELFALKYLEFAKGKDACVFYLEGKDTHFDQC